MAALAVVSRSQRRAVVLHRRLLLSGPISATVEGTDSIALGDEAMLHVVSTNRGRLPWNG